MPTYIYTNQKIKNAETGEEFPLSSIPSNWVEGQEVVLDRDFKIEWREYNQMLIEDNEVAFGEDAEIGEHVVIPIAAEGVKEDKNSEMLKVAMALVRCGWQMACDEILLWCDENKTSESFVTNLLDMMDKEKKRQFDWIKLRAEMEKMGIEHLMPKNV